MDKLRIRVITAIGARNMYPGGINEIKEIGEANSDYRIEISLRMDGRLTFSGDDYKYFEALDNSVYRCDTTSIQLQKLKPGTFDEWEYLREATLSMRSGNWNRSQCVVSFSLISEDRYIKLDDKKDKEYNVFDLVSQRYGAKWIDIGVNPTSAFNGVRVYDALAAMLNDIYGSANIISDFFQWNSPNPGYTIGNNAALKYLTIYQKSDITRRSISTLTAANKLVLQPVQLIEDLCKEFNLKYRIDENGVFRIEHVSWWIREVGLDLTLSPYSDQVKGLDLFKYTEDKYYRREVFTNEGNEILLTAAVDTGGGLLTDISSPYQSPQMAGVPIEYENECLTGLSTDKELKREVSLIVELLFNAGDGNADNQSDFKGTFLLALDIDGNVLHEPVQYPEPPSIFPIPEHPNNVLGWPQLHYHYWKHERIFKVGIMNTHTTTFISVLPSRIKNDVQFTLCDTSIDMFKYVKDALGNGIISNYNYQFGNGVVQMDLLFPLNNTLTVGAPVANDDSYPVPYNTVLNTQLSALPSLLANDVGAVSAFVETKTTFRGGTVKIMANGHIIFTPKPGTVGRDTFSYAAISGGGYADIANVNLGIRPLNLYVRQVPLAQYLGTGTGGPSFTYTRTLAWFTDAAGTLPIDVTGMAIVFNFSQDLLGTVIEQGLGEGYTQIVWGPSPVNLTFWQIQPGTGYTIII